MGSLNVSEVEMILKLAKRKGALKFGKFKLSSGGTSSFYFDGRLITLDPEGAYLVSTALLKILKESHVEAIAGPTLGADPIVSSVAVMSYREGYPIAGLIVRKDAKRYGGRRAIEGPMVSGMKVAVVDDACTTGTSLLHAIEILEKAGCDVVQVIVILDRGQGGSDEIKRRGYDFIALLEADRQGKISAFGK